MSASVLRPLAALPQETFSQLRAERLAVTRAVSTVRHRLHDRRAKVETLFLALAAIVVASAFILWGL